MSSLLIARCPSACATTPRNGTTPATSRFRPTSVADWACVGTSRRLWRDDWNQLDIDYTDVTAHGWRDLHWQRSKNRSCENFVAFRHEWAASVSSSVAR